MGYTDIQLRYRGRGSLDQLDVAPPQPESLQLGRAYMVGDEVRERPGWFVHEVTVEERRLTLVVELRPPPHVAAAARRASLSSREG